MLRFVKSIKVLIDWLYILLISTNVLDLGVPLYTQPYRTSDRHMAEEVG